jgi:hypothetical protein
MATRRNAILLGTWLLGFVMPLGYIVASEWLYARYGQACLDAVYLGIPVVGLVCLIVCAGSVMALKLPLGARGLLIAGTLLGLFGQIVLAGVVGFCVNGFSGLQ